MLPHRDFLLIGVMVEAVAVALHVAVDLRADPSSSYCSMGLGDVLVQLPCLGSELVVG